MRKKLTFVMVLLFGILVTVTGASTSMLHWRLADLLRPTVPM